MNAENTALLIQAAPTLFRTEEKLYPFAMFHFECGDGWFQLLYDLAVQLEVHARAFDEDQPRADQVKEKFGTLRFYISQGTEPMYVLIREAEERSARTCETCGKPGKTQGRGWLRTTCEEHAQ